MQDAPAQGGGDPLADVQSKLAEVAGQEGLPEEAKAAFTAALEAFAAGLEAMKGGGEPQGPAAVSPEQGASGAVPMSHAGMKR